MTTLRITPAGDNNVLDIIEGETQTCTTDSSRPAALIQWYNYYYLYYSTSDNSDNHSSSWQHCSIYCRRRVRHLHVLQPPVVLLLWHSCIISIIYIKVPVTTVTITPAGDNNVVYIIEGETHTCTCTTDSSRPTAWIQLYNYYYLYYSTSDNNDNHSSWWQQCTRYYRRRVKYIYMYYRLQSSCCLDTVV